MKVRLGIALCAALLSAAAACNTKPTPVPTQSTFDSQIAPTPTPINLTRSDPRLADVPLTQACNLITRQDVGGFFGAETSQPLYRLNHADQVIFPAAPVSANDSYCVYMAFHQPSSKNGAYYQVTYWVDTPDKATPSEWAQTWAEGKSHAAQTISGVGDGAFYGNGQLTFRKGNTYVTIEVIGTKIDTSTAAGVSQQIDIETKVALKALSRMTS
ncbi:MAG: hypothetical protein M1482_01335 [Chloroflexi bacterium]|nr:hypothetical protein [Chloroflexota bacterium]